MGCGYFGKCRNRKRIQTSEGLQNVATLAAKDVRISREQLAEWDASARAWLQTADKSRALQQTQLMLVLGNVNIPVNHLPNVYDSVIQAWIRALQTVNDLIRGMPQMVKDGAVLLDLSCFHIYPNLFVIGDSPKRVGLNDNLVHHSGVLTIGIHVEEDLDAGGIVWSLPLAYLRVYGEPVQCKKSFGTNPSRVSFDQLLFVALGGIMSNWGLRDQPVALVERFLNHLVDYFASLDQRRANC